MNASDIWIPVAITIFVWWFSTGAILILVRLPRHLHSLLLLACTLPAGLAVWGIIDSADNLTTAGVYCGFMCSLLIWGWHEASFLMGKITGPRPFACPDGATSWRRFGYATATLIYHEIALFATLLGLVALTWNAPNQIGVAIFAVLFALRLSAKFNIFLGVPNLTDEFFPAHLQHLKSYLPKRRMNALMPISLLCGAGFIIFTWQQLNDAGSDPARATALVIILTLTCLGVLEHLFMITPLPDAALWRWAVPTRQTPKVDDTVDTPNKVNDLKKAENA
jgi:putative photosynthetic complex assembly protein 2